MNSSVLQGSWLETMAPWRDWVTKHICLTALHEERLSGFEVKLTEGPEYYVSTACNCPHVSMSLVLAVTSSVLMGIDNFDTQLVHGEEIFYAMPEWLWISQSQDKSKNGVKLTRKFWWKSCSTTHPYFLINQQVVRAAEVTNMRGGRFMSVEDIIFLMRKDKVGFM